MHSKRDQWKAAFYYEDQIKALDGIGEYRYGNDIRRYEQAVAKTDKIRSGEHFHRLHSELFPNKFQYVQAMNKAGICVGMVASRLDDIGDWNLPRFYQERVRRVVEARGGNEQFAELADDTCQYAVDLTGRIAYMGEGFVHPDWRHRGLSTLMVRNLMLVCWADWDPAVIHGWMRHKHADTGMAFKWGFTDCYESGMSWKTEPADPTWKDTCFVANRQAGIDHLISNALTACRRLA